MSSIKKAIKSVNKWLCVYCAVVASPLLLSASTLAQNIPLCDATQVSSNQLPVLDSQCPIGQGVWGKNVPSTSASIYWIQCGILDQVMPLSQSKALYSQISTDVWMKPEAKGYRCLLGPYTDSRMATRELVKVKSLEGYKDAFIRHVNRTPIQVTPAGKVAAGNANIIKSATPKTSQKNNIAPPPPTSNLTSQSSHAEQKTTPKRITPIEPLPTTAQSSMTIRFQAKVHNKQYILPYLDDNHQFYMEHNQAWNRLDYPTAIRVCSGLDMRLVNSSEWEALLASKVMIREQWPVQLPYWGEGQKGLFASGKVVPVKANTQLNLVCVK